jgi:hypothetical protein
MSYHRRTPGGWPFCCCASAVFELYDALVFLIVG